MRIRSTLVMAILAVVLVASGCQATWTARATVTPSGSSGNGDSGFGALSGDGRFVAFTSLATDLVPGDTNARRDVFVRDQATRQTTRVSVATGGAQGNGHANQPVISDDGRYVAFTSTATNLGPTGDATGGAFVHDRSTGTTSKITWESGGATVSGSRRVAMSGDGERVAVERLVGSGPTATTEVVAFDRTTGAILHHSPRAWQPALSGDGSSLGVLYLSDVVLDTPTGPVAAANGEFWVWDLATGAAEKVAEPSPDTFGGAVLLPSLSHDGRRAVSWEEVSRGGASFGVTYLHDRDAGTTAIVSVDQDGALLVDGGGASGVPHISADGRFVAFRAAIPVPSPGGGTGSIGTAWVHDVALGRSEARGFAGASFVAVGGLSADGRYLSIAQDGSGVSQVDVFDLRPPFVSSVSPSTLAAGTTPTLTLVGEHLLASTTVEVTGGDGVTVTSSTPISDQQLQVTVEVDPDASAGPRDVTVRTPAPWAGAPRSTSSLHICRECLTVG